jgi:hypothetical protein
LCCTINATRNSFPLIAGTVQNADDMIHIKAQHLEPVNVSDVSVFSHDFH